jgi:hypothetical protein
MIRSKFSLIPYDMTIKRDIAKGKLKFKKSQRCPKYSAAHLEGILRCCRILRVHYFRKNDKIILTSDKTILKFIQWMGHPK